MTNRCGLQYQRYCRDVCGENGFPGGPPTEKCLWLLKETAQADFPVIVFSSGGSLVCEALAELFAHAKSGIRSMMDTGGTLFSMENSHFLFAGAQKGRSDGTAPLFSAASLKPGLCRFGRRLLHRAFSYLTSRLSPVISAGFSRPIMSRSVGARSARRPPWRSLAPVSLSLT